jgi:ActR/RegA family two-component response regulator
MQRIIRRALVSEWYEVEIITNAINAVALVRQKTYSALIVDFHFAEIKNPICAGNLCKPRREFLFQEAHD